MATAAHPSGDGVDLAVTEGTPIMPQISEEVLGISIEIIVTIITKRERCLITIKFL